MNLRIVLLPFLLFMMNLKAQDKYETINSSAFKIQGLSFTSGKEAILKKFGKTTRISEPKYECGFLSEAEQGKKYYSLEYEYFKFTGNIKDGYILEKLRLKPALKYKITYKGQLISQKTTRKEFEHIFGVRISGTEKILFQNGEDAYIFIFFKNRLCTINYWSPC